MKFCLLIVFVSLFFISCSKKESKSTAAPSIIPAIDSSCNGNPCVN